MVEDGPAVTKVWAHDHQQRLIMDAQELEDLYKEACRMSEPWRAESTVMSLHTEETKENMREQDDKRGRRKIDRSSRFNVYKSVIH